MADWPLLKKKLPNVTKTNFMGDFLGLLAWPGLAGSKNFYNNYQHYWIDLSHNIYHLLEQIKEGISMSNDSRIWFNLMLQMRDIYFNSDLNHSQISVAAEASTPAITKNNPNQHEQIRSEEATPLELMGKSVGTKITTFLEMR